MPDTTQYDFGVTTPMEATGYLVTRRGSRAEYAQTLAQCRDLTAALTIATALTATQPTVEEIEAANAAGDARPLVTGAHSYSERLRTAGRCQAPACPHRFLHRHDDDDTQDRVAAYRAVKEHLYAAIASDFGRERAELALIEGSLAAMADRLMDYGLIRFQEAGA